MRTMLQHVSAWSALDQMPATSWRQSPGQAEAFIAGVRETEGDESHLTSFCRQAEANSSGFLAAC